MMEHIQKEMCSILDFGKSTNESLVWLSRFLFS